MKLLFLPNRVAATAFNPARAHAFFAAITALFFVGAINDARAEESMTNTNEVYFDPYFAGFGFTQFSGDDSSNESFGTLSFGGSGGGLPLDEGGEFTSQAVKTVTYTLTTGNLAAQFTSGGGLFNAGGNTEVGMFANGAGNKEAVGWRDFKTAGNNTGSARSLQVGDVFTITVSATSAFGGMGFSLNDNGTQGGSYANRVSGSRLYVQSVGTAGTWEVNRDGGFTSLGYTVGTTRRDYTFEVYITSETTANVQMLVNGSVVENRAYNLTMNGTAGANIDAFSIWLKDDWNGSNNADIYWKQTTSVRNLGEVELGYYLASGTFDPGKITDGLEADSTGTTSANAVKVGGDAGSAVLLNQENTYTGLTTINGGATARASHANAFGTTAGGVSVTSGGMLELSGNISIGAEALSLRGDGIGAAGALRNTSGNNSWAGVVSLASTDVRINSDAGTLTLGGNLDLAGNTVYIGGVGSTTLNGAIQNGSKTTGNGALWWDGQGTLSLNATPASLAGNIALRSGTVLLGANNALGSGAITVGANATLTLASAGTTARTLNNSLTMATSDNLIFGNSGNTGNIDISGGLAMNLTAANHFLNVTNSATKVSFAGAVTGTGKNLIKVGAGTLSLGGNNTFTGLTAIDAGTLQITAGTQSTSGIDIGTTTAGITALAAALNITAANNYTINRNVTVKTGGDRTLDFGQSSGLNTISGTVTLDKVLTVAVANSSAVGGLSGVVSGVGGLTKTGAGSLTLSGAGANTYAGLTTVSGGVLELNKTAGVNAIAGNVSIGGGATLLISQSNQVANTSAVTLSGGTIQRASGVSEVFGNLNITSASFLNFGSGSAGDFQFQTYANTGSALVTVQNFFEGNRLQFLSTSFNAGNLSQFTFDNAYTTSVQGDYFTITAIPEPSTYVAAAGLLALFLWPVRRRLIKDAKSILGLRAPARERLEAYRNA